MITGTTRIAAVIGWPVEHSRSPQLLNAAFAATGIDAVMVPIGVPPERFADAVTGLRAMTALGASVTVPHKVSAAALCDQLSPAAREIGAVNCLQFSADGLVGHNTDAPGFLDGLDAAGFATRAPRCVLLGGGGAARAVAYGLRERGTVTVIARRPDTVAWTRAVAWSQLATHLATADLVVDCTPAGLTDDDLELPLDALPTTAWIATLIYHRSTRLLERAKQRGHSTVDGRAMLVHQAAHAFAIWTGERAPIDVMSRALDDALRGT